MRLAGRVPGLTELTGADSASPERGRDHLARGSCWTVPRHPRHEARVELPVILVVKAQNGLMAGERLYWDRSTQADQLNVGIRQITYS